MQVAARTLPEKYPYEFFLALAKDQKGADQPFPGSVVSLLDRPQDAWLARWSGADAWFVKPVNPFELGDRLAEILGTTHKEAV